MERVPSSPPRIKQVRSPKRQSPHSRHHRTRTMERVASPKRSNHRLQPSTTKRSYDHLQPSTTKRSFDRHHPSTTNRSYPNHPSTTKNSYTQPSTTTPPLKVDRGMDHGDRVFFVEPFYLRERGPQHNHVVVHGAHGGLRDVAIQLNEVDVASDSSTDTELKVHTHSSISTVIDVYTENNYQASSPKADRPSRSSPSLLYRLCCCFCCYCCARKKKKH
eukprot:CAMPEP_0117428926 /NCGR_PEP_ID=MMETSP0758-20121206/8529_1 /TAXON_ID=63605 /ORGANISM="Percolomonas cosmopolitus, Strain AE-1 (ATCC 50343)" /LENGTH=217 /DNA_ID=CAMNT_0005215561 /DNA_START=635 /DNA_END=1285 /DNA_ORIENTATION=-